MIVEIHNKVSQTVSNLFNRLEDNLTSDFFGTIRLGTETCAEKVITVNFSILSGRYYDKDFGE